MFIFIGSGLSVGHRFGADQEGGAAHSDVVGGAHARVDGVNHMQPGRLRRDQAPNLHFAPGGQTLNA